MRSKNVKGLPSPARSDTTDCSDNEEYAQKVESSISLNDSQQLHDSSNAFSTNVHDRRIISDPCESESVDKSVEHDLVLTTNDVDTARNKSPLKDISNIISVVENADGFIDVVHTNEQVLDSKVQQEFVNKSSENTDTVEEHDIGNEEDDNCCSTHDDVPVGDCPISRSIVSKGGSENTDPANIDDISDRKTAIEDGSENTAPRDTDDVKALDEPSQLDTPRTLQ